MDGAEYDKSKDSAVSLEEVMRGPVKTAPKGKRSGETPPGKVAATVKEIRRTMHKCGVLATRARGALDKGPSWRARMHLATPVGRAVAADDVSLLQELTVPRGDGEWVTDAIWVQTRSCWT